MKSAGKCSREKRKFNSDKLQQIKDQYLSRNHRTSSGFSRFVGNVRPLSLTQLSGIGQFIIVFIFAIVCYSNSLRGEFVHDDQLAIVKNMDLRSETPIMQLFYNDYWGRPMGDKESHKSYRPLTVISFRLVQFTKVLHEMILEISPFVNAIQVRIHF